MTRRRERSELVAELAVFVEQFVRAVALHPIFELLQMFGVLEISDRDLMRAPGTLDWLAVDEFWSCPTLGRAEDDHGPARTLLAFRLTARPRGALNLANLRQNRIKRTGETLMNDRRIVALDEMRIVPVSAHQSGQLLAADASKNRRIGDLKTIEMKDRKNRAIAHRVQKFVGVPTCGQRASFRFAVADDAGDDQIRIVEGGAIGMSQ